MKKQITLAAVLDVKKKLESLPGIDNTQRIVTTREEISVLKKQITELRNRGYTFVQIAEQLSRHGIEVKESTLRMYRKSGKLERQSVSETHRAAPVTVSAVKEEESKTRPPVGSRSGPFEQLECGNR